MISLLANFKFLCVRSRIQPVGLTRNLNTSHTLIWAVDWLKVQAGNYAVVDPNDPGTVLYLTDPEYKEYWRVCSSTRQALVVLARPGEVKPLDSAITASKPSKLPLSTWFRRSRIYSRVARYLWGSLWEGYSVVPFDRNIRVFLGVWANTLRQWTGMPSTNSAISSDGAEGTRYLLRILKNHGALGLCLFLKVSFLAVQRYLSGNPLAATWDLGFGVRLTNGLPKWIPRAARTAIRQRSHRVIRV
jgi:hypothetical protein